MKKIILGTVLTLAFAIVVGGVDAKQRGFHRKNTKAAVTEFQAAQTLGFNAETIANTLHTYTTTIRNKVFANPSLKAYKTFVDALDDIAESAAQKGTPKTTAGYATKANRLWDAAKTKADFSTFISVVQADAKAAIAAISPLIGNRQITQMGNTPTLLAITKAYIILGELAGMVPPAAFGTVTTTPGVTTQPYQPLVKKSGRAG